MIVQYCITNKITSKSCWVLSDCLAAIEIVGKQREPQKRLRMFKKIWVLCEEMKKLKLVLCLCWVSGHVGIGYNEQADKAAKDGYNMTNETEKITVKYERCVKMAKEQVMKLWQTAWTHANTGVSTREIIKFVNNKMKLSVERSTGISYVRCLLNDAKVKNNM